MKKSILVICSFLFLLQLTAQTDLDLDWMDDAWEKSFGLSDATETDAYQDLDGDHIANIFEYKLGSDPTDPNSPYAISYNPKDDLKRIIQNAPKGSVIKIPEGTHSLEWLKFFREDVHIMIQGGWSADFKEYNPRLYPTTLDGGDFTVFSLGFMKQTQNVFIIEGIHTRNNKDIFSPFDISLSDTTNTFIALHECYISGMESGIKVSHYDQAISQIALTKNFIVENTGQGIDVSVTDQVSSQFKILNNTIANNRLNNTGFFSGSAVEISTLNTGNIDLDFRNNIVWGNEKGAFQLAGYGSPITFSQYDYNLIMGLMDLTGEINLPNPCCQKSVDPKFKSGSYELSENSECIDQGMMIGFQYAGIAQDIGADEFGSITTTNTAINYNRLIQVFPNPFKEQFKFTLPDGIKGEIQLSIYTLEGKLREQKTYDGNIGLFEVNTSTYPKGVYILEVKNNSTISSSIIQKI